MNYWPQVWADINGVVDTAIPDLTAQFRATQAERIDWKQLSEDGQLTPPYVVIQSQFRQDPEIGGITATMYRGNITVHLIRSNAGSNIAATIEADLKDLQDLLTDPDTPFDVIQIWDTGFAMDVTENNPVNVVMLGQQLPYSAGSLSFEAVFGEMP